MAKGALSAKVKRDREDELKRLEERIETVLHDFDDCDIENECDSEAAAEDIINIKNKLQCRPKIEIVSSKNSK